MRPYTAIVAAAAMCVTAGCSRAAKHQGAHESPESRNVTLLVTTELRGQIEPCGCTSDPMGDLARTAQLVRELRAAGPTLVLDGGSLLYSEPQVPAAMATQERLKAELLASAATEQLGTDAIGFGPYDLGLGPDAVALPRHVANLPAPGPIPVQAPEVISAGGVRVGVFGVVAPALVAPFGVQAGDPVAAARAAVAALRADAQVVVGLLHMARADAEELVRNVPGIDFALIGAAAPEPDELSAEPSRVNDTWLFQPANRGQAVSRLDISVRGDRGFSDALGEHRARVEIARIDAQVARLRTDLEAWTADPDADQAFLATQKTELARLAQQRAALEATPLRAPATGSYFTLSQIEVRKQLACDPALVAAKVAYDRAAGAANLESTTREPPPVAAGSARYVGGEECSYCHGEAVTFWDATRHAGAWKTLVDAGKQYNLACVYCHVTGFEAPGGSVLGLLADDDAEAALRDVQCEVCHGPGSRHVEADGKATDTLVRAPASALCVTCHNELHSDTFEYEAYLRDVTGPGHGAAFRERLGDGPTGHQLRSAALDAAGADVGANCPK